MNYKKILRLITISLIIFNFSTLYANETIVYVDMNKIMRTSLVGKSLNNKLKKFNETNLKKFTKTLENLKLEEKKLLKQKNVIDGNEFQEKANKIQSGFNEYKKSIDDYNKNLNKKTINSKAVILKNLTPILSEFAKKNSTSLILNKKNVIIGKTSLDITDKIIKELNNKIKDIKL
jgi:Skp family chaperone for outer membrane proteins